MSKISEKSDRGAPRKTETKESRDAPKKTYRPNDDRVWPEQKHDIYEFAQDDNDMVEFTIHYSYQSKMYKPQERVVLKKPDTEFLGRAMRWVNRDSEERPVKGKAGSWKRAMSELGG